MRYESRRRVIPPIKVSAIDLNYINRYIDYSYFLFTCGWANYAPIHEAEKKRNKK